MPRRWRARPEHSNWGDFGPDDQLGRVNLIDRQKVLQGIAEVREGRVFCLSMPLDFPGGNYHALNRKPPKEAAPAKPTGNAAAPRGTFDSAADLRPPSKASTNALSESQRLRSAALKVEIRRAARTDPAEALRGSGRGASDRSSHHRSLAHPTNITSPVLARTLSAQYRWADH